MVGYGAMVVGITVTGIVLRLSLSVLSPVNGTQARRNSVRHLLLRRCRIPREASAFRLQVATVFMTMCVSALALTSLDSVARIGRMSFQELFYGDTTDPAKMSPLQRVLTNKYFATVITLFFGYLLTLGG